MTRLPHNVAPLRYAVNQVALTRALVSAVGSFRCGPFAGAALARRAALGAWVLMRRIFVVNLPLVHRLVGRPYAQGAAAMPLTCRPDESRYRLVALQLRR